MRAVPRLIDCIADDLERRIDIAHNQAWRQAHDALATLGQPLVTRYVVIADVRQLMNAPVDLDDRVVLGAVEIGDELADRVLAAEL